MIVLLVLGVSLIAARISLAADAPVTLMTYSQGDNRLGLDAQPNETPLKIAGKAIAKGISTSTAVLEFELEQEFKSFSVDIGMTEGATGAGTFYILLDGAIVHQSAQAPTQDAKTIELPCNGVGKITLAAHVAAGDLLEFALVAPALHRHADERVTSDPLQLSDDLALGHGSYATCCACSTQ